MAEIESFTLGRAHPSYGEPEFQYTIDTYLGEHNRI